MKYILLQDKIIETIFALSKFYNYFKNFLVSNYDFYTYVLCAPVADSLYRSVCHMFHRKVSTALVCVQDRKQGADQMSQQILQQNKTKIFFFKLNIKFCMLS